jgi:hypothetical protein
LAYFQCIADNIERCEKHAKWSNFKAAYFALLEIYANSGEAQASLRLPAV